MDAAAGRGADDEAELWRSRLYRYLAGVMELDASVAADYHELQVREGGRSRLYRYLAGVMELDASVAADYHELQVCVGGGGGPACTATWPE